MIYFSDDYNFKKQNFLTMYNFFQSYNVEFDYDKENTDLKKGILTPFKITEEDNNIDIDTIYTEKYMGINLYSAYIYELLFICSSIQRWEEFEISAKNRELCIFLYNNFKKELLLCRKKAIFFIRYWNDILKQKDIDAGISFGGSLIYANCYAKVLALKQVPHFCLEHFFTGNDFYFEERYEPLPNNSILQNKAFCDIKLNSVKDKINKFRKLKNSKNKNVKQPAYISPLESGYVLILAQVRNDFSISSPNNTYKNSIKLYLDITNKLLNNTKYNIIIKTHPYEIKKVSDRSLTTMSVLKNKIMCESIARERVHIVDDWSINSLIDNARLIVTLNSQSGLQAVARFKPVVCFGSAFYGHKGFTFDYIDIDDFIKNIDQIHMTLDSYSKYLDFMDVCFEHLIGIGEENKYKEIFESRIKISASKITTSKQQNHLELKQIHNNPSSAFTWRKLRKLIRSPRKYFEDARLNRLKRLSSK